MPSIKPIFVYTFNITDRDFKKKGKNPIIYLVFTTIGKVIGDIFCIQKCNFSKNDLHFLHD